MKYSETNLARQDKRNTKLTLKFDPDNEVIQHLGRSLPFPIEHYYKDGSLFLVFLIDGFFATKQSTEYLNDIIARFQLTYGSRLYQYKTSIEEPNDQPVKLQAFQSLKSRQTQQKYNCCRFDCSHDMVFYCLKTHAEMLCKEKNFFSFSELLDYGTRNFVDVCKDKSTLRAKCRNIWSWYDDRDFRPTQKRQKKEEGEVMATRREQAEKMTKIRMNRARNQVFSLVNGLFSENYKKKNGDWNVSKIAKESGANRRTVMKYVEEFDRSEIKKENHKMIDYDTKISEVAEELVKWREKEGRFWRKKVLDEIEKNDTKNYRLRQFRNRWDFFYILHRIKNNNSVEEIYLILQQSVF